MNENTSKLFKDLNVLKNINKINENLKTLLKIIEDENYPNNLLPSDRKTEPHNPNHNRCETIIRSTEKENEKRTCRCWYFYNTPNKDINCNACPYLFKRKNVGKYKIVDFEVPTKFKIKHLGEIDWLLSYNETLIAAEVKPRKANNESIARMIAEILTYTIDTDYTPAICFFLTNDKNNPTPQYSEYLNIKDNADFIKILQLTNIQVLYVTYTDTTFEIHNVKDKPLSETYINNVIATNPTLNKTLDLSIKNHENKRTSGGYYINNRTYNSYMTSEDWEAFKNDMIKNHNQAYIEFIAGGGGELNCKNNYPPKMASYGSSSRMIYNLCKENPNFHYEYPLATTIGGTAYLDGFMETENSLVFVEAKCREPYSKNSTPIKSAYKNFYEHITNASTCNLKIISNEEKGKQYADFFADNTQIIKFDIKQMISHFLGIANKVLNCPTTKKLQFIYLLFNPNKIDITDKSKANSIFNVYETTCNEFNSIDFKGLFLTILNYLNTQNGNNVSCDKIQEIADNFSIVLKNQDNFVDFIKQL